MLSPFLMERLRFGILCTKALSKATRIWYAADVVINDISKTENEKTRRIASPQIREPEISHCSAQQL